MGPVEGRVRVAPVGRHDPPPVVNAPTSTGNVPTVSESPVLNWQQMSFSSATNRQIKTAERSVGESLYVPLEQLPSSKSIVAPSHTGVLH